MLSHKEKRRQSELLTAETEFDKSLVLNLFKCRIVKDTLYR